MQEQMQIVHKSYGGCGPGTKISMYGGTTVVDVDTGLH